MQQQTRLGGGRTGSLPVRTCRTSQLCTTQRAQRRCLRSAAQATFLADAPPASQAEQQPEPFTQQEWDSFVAAYTSQYEEHAMWLDEASVEGTIPPELRGTLLRNGPALYEIGGKKIPQPFDGDGMIAQFCFPGEGKAPFFANRFVRTQAFLEEQAAQRMIHRGAFSVGNPSGGLFFNPFDLSVKKPANTGVVRWGGRLMALYERDMPYELQGPDLRTAGPTDCEGAIDGPFCAAHYRIFTEPDGSQRLLAFNAAEAGLDNAVTVWEFDENMRQLHRTALTLPDAAFAFLHDFVATENYYVFLENPIRMDYWKLMTEYMLGKACLAECLRYDPSRETKVHLLPRPGRPGKEGAPPGARPARVFSTPRPFFSFHHANAFEAPDGRVVIDTVALFEGMDFGATLETGATYFTDDVGRGTLTRLTLTPWTGGVTCDRLMARACEFPCVAPSHVGQPHTHTYLVGSRIDSPAAWSALQETCKVTVAPGAGVGGALNAADEVTQTVYSPGRGRWAQEPIFVPRPGGQAEDDGWVLVLVFDSGVKKTELAILDAKTMVPVATVKLPFMLPAGLHGSFTPEFLGPQPGEDYPARKYDIRAGADLYE